MPKTDTKPSGDLYVLVVEVRWSVPRPIVVRANKMDDVSAYGHLVADKSARAGVTVERVGVSLVGARFVDLTEDEKPGVLPA
jgi:hypothetical protein